MKFDAIKEKNNIVKFIKDYYNKHNLGGAVIGISGGKDSGVVAALLVEALGKDNVIGFTLPCHSKDEDRNDAKLVSDYYGFKLYNFDLTNIFDSFKKELVNMGSYDEFQTKNSDINLKPRLRMSTLYYMAALFSSLNNKTYLVAGTSNKSELFVGYFTKGGDSVHDISAIADFTVEEVIKIGEVLKVPEVVLYKKPADGLSTLSDEDKLGVSYKDIANYMVDPKGVNEEVGNKIKKMHDNNQHKFNIPTYRR
ncbi:MAG: NAD(+) synthase [Tenericutes bacterium]|nr:NAD(+) synthase [Bacilli bacterium]MDD4831368.1 NAD(+) synthase [Bacilli bacterium]NLV90543.1 NAD(+) synthase [Mycoplasmatota bacterium]